VRYVLGIDAGGTKTVCILADEQGEAIAEARSSGANLQAVGELEVEKVLHQVMEDALGDRGILPQAICLGIAGVDRDDDLAIVRSIMRRIAYKARTLVVNDALVALVAGAGAEPGLVLVAGTGSIAYGRNREARAARAGGWGYVLGDEGSGYWIGRRALGAVVRQADQRGRPTLLTGRLLQHFGIGKPQDLVQVVYYRNLRPSAIAALATHVSQAAQDGDEVAREILAEGAEELLGAARSVISRLHLDAEPFVCVFAGGIFQAVPWLADHLRTRLLETSPRCQVTRLERPAAIGAVQLAIDELRGGAVIPAYL
jgi:N-acetylglucosamine kinase-like BadF-type ATPase